jgi:hypothetical protein
MSEQITMSPEKIAAAEAERARLIKQLNQKVTEANPPGLVPTAVEEKPSLRALIREARKTESPKLASLGSRVEQAAAEQKQSTREGAQTTIAPHVAMAEQAIQDWGVLRSGIQDRVAALSAMNWDGVLLSVKGRTLASDRSRNVSEVVGMLKMVVDELHGAFARTTWKDVADALAAAEGLNEITSANAGATAGALEYYAKRAAGTVASTTTQVRTFVRLLAEVERELEACGATLTPAVAPESDRLAELQKEPARGGSSIPMGNPYVGTNFPAEGR